MIKDKIEMEYESRAMLDEKTYDLLISDHLNVHYSQTSNINIYFDTKELLLTNSSIVLRKRYVNNSLELTLKIKTSNGDKEITINNVKDSDDITTLLSSYMIKELDKKNIDIHQLTIVGKLTTYRTEVFYEDYTLVIDKNIYNQKVDFNVEIESSTKEKADYYLSLLSTKYKFLICSNYISKSRRAILNF